MRILLPTDGSNDAIEAARFLSRLPHREPIDLVIVTAIANPELHPADTSGTWPAEVWDQLNASAQETLAKVAQMFEGADATVTEKILVGHAGYKIADEARKCNADLVVLGAKGHTAIGRVMLGSVSDYVATHCDCSVMIVRPNRQGSHPSSIGATIAYDGSQRATVALDQFAQFDWGPTTTTNVLTIVPIVRFFGRDVFPETLLRRSEQHEIASQATEQATRRIASTGTVIAAHVVETEHVGEGIVNFAEKEQSDLLVVGDTGASGISRMLLGSVSRYVLRHADCSVWIARPKAHT